MNAYSLYNIAANPMTIAPKNPLSWTALAPLLDVGAGPLPVELAPAALLGPDVTVDTTVELTDVEFSPRLVALEVLLAVEFENAPPVGMVVKYYGY